MPVVLEDNHIKINEVVQIFDDVSNANLNSKLFARAGTNVSINASGVISSIIPSATSSVSGGIIVGNNLTISSGVLSGSAPQSLTPYRLVNDSYTKGEVDTRDTNTSNVISTRITNLPPPNLESYRLITDSYTELEVDTTDSNSSNAISTRITNFPAFPSLTPYRLPPKNGLIALWPNTRAVKCEYSVSQKHNGFNNKDDWYNFLLTFVF